MVYAVTGYNGLIGSHMVEYLEGMGHRVIKVDCDVKDYRELGHFIGGVDGVFHFAANMGGVGYNTANQLVPPIDNLTMDINIIRFCMEHDIKFLYPSSACVYPVHRMDIPLYEGLLDEPALPDKAYGLEKYAVTMLLRNCPQARVAILHTIYGEQLYVPEKAKFPLQICYKFAHDNPVEVWGDGSQIRTFLHVKDAVKMIYEVFESDYYGEVNISHDKPCSVKHIADVLSKESGKGVKYIDGPTGPIIRTADMTKFFKYYNTRPAISVEDGFISLYRSLL